METDGLAGTSVPARMEFSGVMVIDATTVAEPAKPKTLYITGGFHTGVEVFMGAFRY